MILIIFLLYLLVLIFLSFFWFIVAYNIYAVVTALLLCSRPMTIDSFFSAYLTKWQDLVYYIRRKLFNKKNKKN